jgi:hypothetical protein
LRPARGFYVQDLGSVHGTYIKVSKDHGENMKKGQAYLIGTDIYFNVVELILPLDPEILKSRKVVSTTQDFMNYLYKES